MPFVNLLVKPASSLCNMRCRYCFYEDEAANRSQASMGIMSEETAALLIRQALDAAGKDGALSVAFQGGEPTVAGLDFFRAFVAAVQRYNTAGLPVSYAIQTNGLGLDEGWVEFLVRNHFLVGVSVDGDKALHDEFRLDAAGKGTWTRVQKNLTMLRKAGAECNLLCVVTRRCAKSAVRTYHALQKTGVGYLQFIPCLDPLGEERGQRTWSLTPEDYGNFLCTLFDEWCRDWEQGRYTSVRLFDDYVHLAMGLPPSTCATGGHCGAYFVVEADGSVYPCDFYVLDEWEISTKPRWRNCKTAPVPRNFWKKGTGARLSAPVAPGSIFASAAASGTGPPGRMVTPETTIARRSGASLPTQNPACGGSRRRKRQSGVVCRYKLMAQNRKTRPALRDAALDGFVFLQKNGLAKSQVIL